MMSRWVMFIMVGVIVVTFVMPASSVLVTMPSQPPQPIISTVVSPVPVQPGDHYTCIYMPGKPNNPINPNYPPNERIITHQPDKCPYGYAGPYPQKPNQNFYPYPPEEPVMVNPAKY